MIFIALIILALLLLTSVFFSASETGLVSLSPQKAKSLAVRRPRVALAMQGWLARPHELLTLILVGSTFVNVLFAALLTVVLSRVLPATAYSTVRFYSWILGTILVVLFAEMVPKFFARVNPERTSLFVLPWLARLNYMVAPLLKIIIEPLRFFFPQWKSPPVGQILTLSLEELKALLEEEAGGDSNKDESRDMMKRILEINDRRVESIMTKLESVATVDFDPTGRSRPDKELLIDLIVEEGHTRTPVKLGGQFVGFIHSDDLMPFLLRDSQRDLTHLIRQALDVPFDRKVGDLLQDFRSSSVHIGFVKDPNGKILGIVTLEDVLEEITGEILDEYDVAHPPSESSS